jgi:hypothetical protein
MAVSRAQATTYLAGQYGSGANNLLALADIGATDTTGDLKEPIDDAALLLGTSFGDLTTVSIGDSDAPAYFAALRYTTLKRILDGLNAKSQQGVAQVGQGVSLDVRDWIKRIQSALALAAAECRSLGLNVTTTGSSSWAAIGALNGVPGWNLDYLQTVETADA